MPTVQTLKYIHTIVISGVALFLLKKPQTSVQTIVTADGARLWIITSVSIRHKEQADRQSVTKR